MRQLHVVALSEDGRYVLLAPNREATKGDFRVALDTRLTAAVRGELPRPGQTTAPASDLTPKDIQARLRAGESVDEIARSAGVPAARVERFAGPVVSERARMVDAARAAAVSRPRRGLSAVPLGRAVDTHLAESSVDSSEVVWTARRQGDGAWLVEAAFTGRGRRKKAGWRYDHHTRELTAVDASSAVLGYVDPPDGRHPGKVVAAVTSRAARRPRSRTAGAAASARRSAAATQAPASAKQATGRSPKATGTTAKASAAPVNRAKATAGKAKPAKASPAKATQQKPTKASTAKGRAKSRTAKAPAKVAEKAPAKKAKAPAKAMTTKAAKTVQPPARRATAPARRGKLPAEQRPQLRVVPPVDETPRVRATVPGWADVLLSTTPPSRPAAARHPDED